MMINDDDISRATQKDCAPQILATAQLAPPRPAASGHIGDDDEDGDGDDDEDGDNDYDRPVIVVSHDIDRIQVIGSPLNH